jgi:phosphatidate phosphatase PAH1
VGRLTIALLLSTCALSAPWLGCGSGDGNEATFSTTAVGSGSGGQGGDATSAQGGEAQGGNAQGGGLPSCIPMPACDDMPPDPGATEEWNSSLTPVLTTSQGSPRHRGRDLFLNPGDEQWVLAKFAYGPADKDLKGENVDVYLQRDCEGGFELLGRTTTTEENEHATVEGVLDTGGRIYFPIPSNATLGVGRHRIHLVVRGDLSTTDVLIDVVPAGTIMFASDVDGTLTTEETEEFTALLSGDLPHANAFAPQVMWALYNKGYRAFYLTARPEWLGDRTRAFLQRRGFPPGLFHTTLNKTGALGGAAVGYKTGELAWLSNKGMSPAWAFGNTDSDGEAYDNAGIMPLDQRIFYQFDDPFGGRRIDDYADLLSEIEALPPVCEL